MTAPKLVAITANTSWYRCNFRGNLIKALLEQGYRVLAIAGLGSDKVWWVSDKSAK